MQPGQVRRRVSRRRLIQWGAAGMALALSACASGGTTSRAAAAYQALPPPPAHRAPLVDSVSFSRQRLFLSHWSPINDPMNKDLDDTLTTDSKTAQNACRDVQPLLTGS